jgi:hypothetical protein
MELLSFYAVVVACLVGQWLVWKRLYEPSAIYLRHVLGGAVCHRDGGRV